MSLPAVPRRAGFNVTAVVWKWDRPRRRWRIEQVAYEPRRKAEKPDRPPARQGTLLL